MSTKKMENKMENEVENTTEELQTKVETKKGKIKRTLHEIALTDGQKKFVRNIGIGVAGLLAFKVGKGVYAEYKSQNSSDCIEVESHEVSDTPSETAVE